MRMTCLPVALLALSIPMAAQNVAYRRLFVPQIVDGGSWTTSFVIYNPSTRSPATGTLHFFSDAGSALLLSLIIGGASQQTTAQVAVSLAPNGSLKIETLGLSPSTAQGYAIFVRNAGDGNVVATFRQRVTGRPDFESSIEGLLPDYPGLVVPYDNTNGFSTSFALVNSDSLPATYAITFYDGAGTVVSANALSLNPGQHIAFSSPVRFPDTFGKTGTALISRSALMTSTGEYPYMALTAFRFNPTGASAVMPLYIILD
jgi:hypothetical protein